jgi:hypothetical protein
MRGHRTTICLAPEPAQTSGLTGGLPRVTAGHLMKEAATAGRESGIQMGAPLTRAMMAVAMPAAINAYWSVKAPISQPQKF